MKKTIGKILKDIIDSTSITDMCDKSVCHWLQPVIDTIVFPEYFSSYCARGFTNIWSNSRRNDEAHLQKNEEKYMWVHKIFEKVIVAFLLFYSMKTIIYFIALKHHSF